MLCTLENETSSALTVAEVLDPNQHSLTTGKTVYKIESFFIVKLSCFRKRRHLNQFPHKCSQCVKRFFTRQELAAHIRTHTGEKPFVCQRCSKSFSRIHHLKRHMESVHSEKVKGKVLETIGVPIDEEEFEKTETHIEVKLSSPKSSVTDTCVSGFRRWTNFGR